MLWTCNRSSEERSGALFNGRTWRGCRVLHLFGRANSMLSLHIYCLAYHELATGRWGSNLEPYLPGGHTFGGASWSSIARGRLGDTTASCTYSDAHLNALRHCTRGISAALQITVSLGERFGASPTREGLGDTIPRCSQALTILLTSASGKRRGGVLTPMVSQVQSISIVVSVVM